MAAVALFFSAVLSVATPQETVRPALTNAVEVMDSVSRRELGARFRLSGLVVAIRERGPWQYYLDCGGRILRFSAVVPRPPFDNLRIGDRIEVNGDIGRIDDQHPVELCSRRERVLERGFPVSYPSARLEDILSGTGRKQLVTLEGEVTQLFRDPLEPVWVFFELSDQGRSIYCAAFHPPSGNGDDLPPGLIGARVRLRGVFDPELGTRGGWTKPVVHMNRLDDYEVLRSSPWWNRTRLTAALLLMALILVALVLRNHSLRSAARIRLAERTRLAAELHDYFAQDLTAISYRLCAALNAWNVAPGDAREQLALACRMTESCQTELRRCLWDLRNEALDMSVLGDGIRASIGPIVQRIRSSVNVSVRRAGLNDTVVHTAISVVRELVANAVNRGGAGRVSVSGALTAGELRLTVRDNGCGFDPEKAENGVENGHFGLAGIRERVNRNGGEFVIKSARGEGTVVTVVLKGCGK